ncbi:MAG: hypothetical protein E6X17_07590 [Sporomusaceae bacterium]|nr:hypothetical protein [Sporomusaceae bacterium]
MKRKKTLSLLLLSLLTITLLLGGCSGAVERQYGLEPEAVVKTAFDAAKSRKFAKAAAYIAPNTLQASDDAEISDLLTGFGISDVKTANLLSVKKVSSQGRFAVVVATIHQENTLKVNVKSIGLERIDDEWYIVPMERIVLDAKYRLLADLLVGK